LTIARFSTVLPLLDSIGMPAGLARALAAEAGVMALSEVAPPSDAEPLAVLAFRIEYDRRSAMVIGMVVAEPMQRRGVVRRLLADTLTLLRAEGCRTVEAWSAPGDTADHLLQRAAFSVAEVDGVPGGDPVDMPRRLKIEL
jgi:GNAT superfamily N-acetyltransferase